MVKIRLGKSLRNLDLNLFLTLENAGFHNVLEYISKNNVSLSKVEKFIKEINEILKKRGLRIDIRKAVSWDKKADYRLILRKNVLNL